MAGKVWLVGAGPGDAELLTLKAKKVLDEADVIVYDHLAGKSILSMIPGKKEWIYVGKKAGHHSVKQEEINQILVNKAMENKKVARLKGGDPFLFGRGGEEMEELRKNHISFEVIPGVTSSIAVPAYNGIPVTHRDYNSSLHIVTGHRKKDGIEKMNYKSLVEMKGTLVFLMGVGSLSDIMKGLMDAGMSSSMPAAILQEGTTARQKKVVATVGTIVECAKTAQIKAPAVIVVGEVCSLSEELQWYEHLPLMGMRIMLTRPEELIFDMAQKLRSLGAEVLEVPTIDIVSIERNILLLNCLSEIEGYDWIVFTSQIGVRIFFEKLAQKEIDIRKLSNAKFAVIGEGTKQALKETGIFADLMPEVYDGESLGHLLSEKGIRDQKILIPRAKKGNPNLVPILERTGAKVQDLPIYETVFRENECISIIEELDAVDCVVFTSGSTVEGFVKMSAGADYSGFVAACIGEQTKTVAEKYGMNCQVAEKATIDALMKLVERIWKENDKETKATEK